MKKQPTTCSEPREEQRISALQRYQILDTPIEAEFDDFVEMAAEIAQAPVAVINFVDRERQWFKSEIGLGIREMPLDISICKHALLEQDMLVVPDLTHDPRFAANPLVRGEPNLRFYAGALLKSSEGLPLGTLCVLDHKPREMSPTQLHALRVLARQVMTTLELRLAARHLTRQNAKLEDAMAEIKTLRGLLPICSCCKKVRDGESVWLPVEVYVQRFTEASFSHGYCPDCEKTALAEIAARPPSKV